MNIPVLAGLATRFRQRAIQSRLSSLVLLLQRSPLVKILLPEARVISSSGFTEALKWTVAAVTGLGAYDSVSGASVIAQIAPGTGDTVNGVAGNPFSFSYQLQGSTHVPGSWEVSSNLPLGLAHTNTTNNTIDSITGIPRTTGNTNVTVTAWENAGNSGDSFSKTFTIRLTAPPVPTVTTQPSPVGTTSGGFVKLSAAHTNGQTFTWRQNGAALPAADVSIVPLTHARKWFIPTTDPGNAWKTDGAFNDSSWTTANGGIGYDTNTTVNYNTLIDGTRGTTPTNKGFAHIRIPFTMSGPGAISYLKLRYKCDDGFVAWLNGTEIGRFNAPTTLAWNSSAASSTVDTDVFNNWRELAIPAQHVSLLRQGSNLLAIQLMNSSATSNDMLLTCELIGGINATNSPTLVIPALSLAETGSYSLLVNNFTVPAGVPSQAAPVHILPAVATHPQNSSINGGQTAQLTVAATGSSLAYQWYAGTAGDTSSPVDGATAATFTTPPLSTTTTYWVRVSNPGGTVDSDAATVTVLALPPGIATQPAGTSVNATQSARLTVTASGTGPFTYQWYEGASGITAAPVSGATADAFDTPLLAATTSYWVRVTNGAGSVDSDAATVTVLALPPGIATQPAGTSVNLSQSARLTVTASGTGPFTYQWYEGASGITAAPVSGATADAFDTPLLAATTSYWVRVTNGAGSVDSDAATVTVNATPPGISTQPMAATILRGSSATLTVLASGEGLNYQWYSGISGETGNPVAGATTATLQTAALLATTSYWVRVSNNGGNADSNTATVKVIDTIEGWKEAVFTPAQLQDPSISVATADPDGDGLTNEKEYVFGTQPLSYDLPPSLTIAGEANGSPFTLRYPTTPASGPGYTNLTRSYFIDATDDISGGGWQPLTGEPQISPDGMATLVVSAGTAGHRYYRLRVNLGQ